MDIFEKVIIWIVVLLLGMLLILHLPCSQHIAGFMRGVLSPWHVDVSCR